MTKEVGDLVGWSVCQYKDLLEYLQPTKYIVESTKYNDSYKTPVLTAGKSFIKGYTNEVEGIFYDLPVIIFDDFTTASKYVNFSFKVKSSAMKILIPSCKLVNLKFVFYCMQNDRIRSDTHKRYWISVYSIKKLHLPPLAEQNRIVTKIEQIFSELDKGIENLKKAREQLKVYRQVVLNHAFEGKLTETWREQNEDKLETGNQLLVRIQKKRETQYQLRLEKWNKKVKKWEGNGKNEKKPVKPKLYHPTVLQDSDKELLTEIPDGWSWVYFSELLLSIRGGTTVPPVDVMTNFPVLRSSSVRSGVIDYRDIRYISEDKIKSEQDFVEEGDMLFSRLNGTVDYVGNCAVIDNNHPDNLIYPDRLYCAKLIDKKLSSYCEYFFESPSVRRHIEEKAKSTAGHKRISIPDITEYPVQLPSIDESLEISKVLDQKFTLIRKVEQEIDENVAHAETLRQSILKKAFSGQLVEQNSMDEPASVLLERIKVEKEKQESSSPKKKVSKKKTNKRKATA